LIALSAHFDGNVEVATKKERPDRGGEALLG